MEGIPINEFFMKTLITSTASSVWISLKAAAWSLAFCIRETPIAKKNRDATHSRPHFVPNSPIQSLKTLIYQVTNTFHMHRMRKHIHRLHFHRPIPAILQHP